MYIFEPSHSYWLLCSKHFIFVFEVTRSPTVIPLIQSIDLLSTTLWRTTGPDIKLGRENLIKLFFFATAQTNFSFLSNFYDQTDGVTMRSPLAPVLACLFTPRR